MKSLKELMAEMGFNQDAPMATGEAFVRHLLWAAAAVEVKPINPKPEKTLPKKADVKKEAAPVQLEFDFGSGKQVS